MQIVINEEFLKKITVPEQGKDIADFVQVLATFLTKSAEQGKAIHEVAKNGVKGIAEWSKIIAKMPEIIRMFVEFYVNFVKPINDLGPAIMDMTEEQKTEAVKVFAEKFDIINDAAELIVEKSVELLLNFAQIISTLDETRK